MTEPGWLNETLHWLLRSPDSISAHLALLIMFAAALALRRSLGCWPVWCAALFGALAIEIWWSAFGIAHAPWPLSLLNMLAIPTLIFHLARTQQLTGLRRSEPGNVQRNQWRMTGKRMPVAQAPHRRVSAPAAALSPVPSRATGRPHLRLVD